MKSENFKEKALKMKTELFLLYPLLLNIDQLVNIVLHEFLIWHFSDYMKCV